MEDPGVVDAGVSTGKARHGDDRSLRGTYYMRQGSRLNFKNVVVCLCWMNTSVGVPVKATTNRRGDILAIAVTQRQRT